MDYEIRFQPRFEKQMKKLKKKNKALSEQIKKKLEEVVMQPEHYKPLGNVLHGLRRIHFGSFVLIYRVEGNLVKVLKVEHHDDSY